MVSINFGPGGKSVAADEFLTERPNLLGSLQLQNVGDCSKATLRCLWMPETDLDNYRLRYEKIKLGRCVSHHSRVMF